MENVLCLRKSALTPLLFAPLRHFLSGFCCRFAHSLSDTLEMSIKRNCEMIEFPLSDDARLKKHVFSSNAKRPGGGCPKFCQVFSPTATAALAVVKLSPFLPSFLFSIRSLCLRALNIIFEYLPRPLEAPRFYLEVLINLRLLVPPQRSVGLRARQCSTSIPNMSTG